MFSRPTVLILGAGASCHFGYPTGQQLVDGILSLMSQEDHPLKGKDRRRTENVDDPIYPNHQLLFANFDNTAFYGDGRPATKNAEGFTLSSFLDHAKRNSQPILIDNNKDFSSDFLEACRHSDSFYQTLKSFDPINIDAFLGLFKGKFEKIGKYWIAKYLLECENTACFDRKHSASSLDSEKLWPPYNQNWYRYLLDALLSGIQGLPTSEDNRPRKEGDELIFQEAYKESYEKLQESFSNLFVLTFNYDVSLEYFLFYCLSSIPAIGRDFAHYLLNNCAHIHHVYGSLYDPLGADPLDPKKRHIESYGNHYKDRRIDEKNSNDQFSNFQTWAKFCWDCAGNIHTIGGEKHKDNELEQKIKKKIWDPLSDKIAPGPDGTTKRDPKFFFLGFGCDPQNTELIGLLEVLKKLANPNNLPHVLSNMHAPNTYWTNYNNSKAWHQRFLSSTGFQDGTLEFKRIESLNSSPRTVYQALTYDFSFL
jgi:hypothetical protein